MLQSDGKPIQRFLRWVRVKAHCITGKELLLRFPDSNVQVMGRSKNVGFFESNNTVQCITIIVTVHGLEDKLLASLLLIWRRLWRDDFFSLLLLLDLMLFVNRSFEARV